MTNNKELFLKGIKNLFLLHCVALACSVLSSVPLLGTLFSWVNLILSAIIVLTLFQLAPVNNRYRKASIFMAVVVAISLITHFSENGLLTFVGAICTLIAAYQEYSAHSEMMNGIDEKLSGKWHTLFNWQIIGGIILGVLGAPLAVLLGVALLMDTNILTAVVLVLITCFDVVIGIIYLIYLKRMHHAYEGYVPKAESEIPEGEI